MQENPSVWLLDDDASIRFVLEKALARVDLATRSFSRSADVLAALATGAQPQVLISDIRMSGGSGLDLLAQIKSDYPAIVVIIMTAFSDLDSAVGAFSRGAFEYLAKPFDVHAAIDLVQRALAHAAAHQAAHQPTQADAAALPDLLGQAPAMQEVFRAIGRLSNSSVTVLITGESGTGKELVARALHKHSPVANGPFVAINTAAIPKDLLESELFGHEKGSFTGAQALRRGRFEQAQGGTLFLDEIGDMPFELQTRLLRVLSDGQFYRVGGLQSVKVEARIIAATHQDLAQRVRDGLFREDLLHRLHVIRLQLPALRERPEDIPLLAQHLMQSAARKLGVSAKTLAPQSIALLQQCPFPGNVRQLENLCHWLTVMSPGQMVQVQDLPQDILSAAQQRSAPDASLPAQTPSSSSDASFAALATNTAAPSLAPAPVSSTWQTQLREQALGLLATEQAEVWGQLLREFEKTLIASSLEACGGKRTEAAQKLGIGRNTMTRKCQELGFE